MNCKLLPVALLASMTIAESIPGRLAGLISRRLEIPTIGIGAGAGCDGQVLVSYDLLGLFERFTPRFVKKYANLNADLKRAFTEYIDDLVPVRSRSCPNDRWAPAPAPQRPSP